jgi:predicted PolB exonuclease-like 3'-5' exonuclease
MLERNIEGRAMPHVIVWDIETVPDLKGYAAANGHDGKTDDEVRVELGEKFPKHIYHSIITFNGSSFDLPVFRYRAMVHKVPAFGLSVRPYFHRYTDDAVD